MAEFSQESSEESDCDPEVEERIYFTVETGDSVLLKTLLAQGYNPNYKFEGKLFGKQV